MTLDLSLDTERWLSQQGSVILALFDSAAEQLQAIGIRILTGSVPPTLEDLHDCKRIKLSPIRFSSTEGGETLFLSLVATARRGLPRYVIMVQVSGALTLQALQKLTQEHSEIWYKTYLKNGLWISEGENVTPLSDLSQIKQSLSSEISIVGVFLHCDLNRTVQGGVMVMGLLYRSILDELSGASRMGRLFARLSNVLGDDIPRFQRIVRP